MAAASGHVELIPQKIAEGYSIHDRTKKDEPLYIIHATA
jgi:hypothetical protein